VPHPDPPPPGIETEHPDDRSEDPLARDAPRVVDVRKDARAEVEPGSVGYVAAGDELRALLLPDLEVREGRPPLSLADQRAHLGRLLERRSHPDRVGPFGEPRHELVVDRPLDQLAGASAAV